MDNLESEIQAMATAAKAIDPLDDPAKHRVLNWLAERFGTSNLVSEDVAQDDTGESNSAQYDEFAEFFDVFNPASDSERLLAGAYWHQVVEENSSWYSVSINKLLKPTGYGIGKISRVLSAELKQRPARVIQLKRSGSNRQAKKACKLTSEGIKFVELRLKG